MMVNSAAATMTSVSVKPRWRLFAFMARPFGSDTLRLHRVDHEIAVTQTFVPFQDGADLQEGGLGSGARVGGRSDGVQARHEDQRDLRLVEVLHLGVPRR